MKEQILAVQRMQDYIEAHLEEKIGLAELSGVSLLSPWYSYRLFQEYTGLTPAGYIRRLRRAKAALRIKKEHIRMIDAAFDLGFGSVDGYDPGVIGYGWDDTNPRIQLEPRGSRGYIELRAITKK